MFQDNYYCIQSVRAFPIQEMAQNSLWSLTQYCNQDKHLKCFISSQTRSFCLPAIFFAAKAQQTQSNPQRLSDLAVNKKLHKIKTTFF